MSHKNYSEYEPTDSEIEDLLDELYPDDVIVCGMYMSQSYILKEMDRVAFDSFASDMMRWYICDACGTIHRDDDAEESAKECCQEYCDECGQALEDNETGLCENCQAIEDEENAKI